MRKKTKHNLAVLSLKSQQEVRKKSLNNNKSRCSK